MRLERSILAAAVGLALSVAATPTSSAQSGQDAPRAVLVTYSCTETNFFCPPFLRALRRTGVSGRIVSPDEREDKVATLSLLARQGFELIVVDWDWAQALGKVAPSFPHTQFAIFDVPLSQIRGRPRNVEALFVRTHEASYLAGWLAARMEQRRAGADVVGAVGGWPIPAVDDFVVGFRAGARAAVPSTRVLVGYSRDFGDATKCRAVARRQIAQGAGVVFNVAGLCGLGVLEAAKEARIWGIGVDNDQSSLGPHVLTSVVKWVDAHFLRQLRWVRTGRPPRRGQVELSVADGASGLGRISPKVPASLRREIEGVRRRIVAGEIRVPGDPPR